MTYIPDRINNFSQNAASAYRVSKMTTLFDGKVLGQEDLDLFDNEGTGTSTYIDNKVNLSVTSGQYRIRQGKRFCPYFSGKSQLVEITFDGFQTEGDCIKQAGYFSSSTVAPYTADLDGFFIENNAGVFSIQMYRNGTQTININFTAMDNYDAIASYNWQNFTVLAFDFLWLGGAVLRFFVKVGDSFELIHTVNYAGSAQDIFMLSPNQPIRYVLRSITSVGSFRNICSQVATEGSTNESGKTRSFYNVTPITTNNVNEIYPLIAIRKSATFKTIATQIVEISCINSATTDSGLLMLIKNGTQTGAAMTFAANGKIEISFNSNAAQRITTGTGTLICAVPISSSGNVTDIMSNNYESILTDSIDGTTDIYYVCYRPISATQSNTAVLTIKEF
jgi:hypothetical protein